MESETVMAGSAEEKELQYDRKCHVLYSEPCKKQIQKKLAQHYPEALRETVWERIRQQYVDYLRDWRTDLGGRKNFHNGIGGTYDCIALMSYYTVCKEVTNIAELEEMEGELFLPAFRKLGFVDCNKALWKRLLHLAFAVSKKKCDRWGDFQMNLAPFDQNATAVRFEADESQSDNGTRDTTCQLPLCRLAR